MIKLFNQIFMISFNSYTEYVSSINNINNWEIKRRNIYNSLNDLVFTFIKRKSLKTKINNQFLLDYINYFLYDHFSIRYKYLKNRRIKSKFIFWSFIQLYLSSLRTILISVKNNSFDFELGKISDIKDVNVCIGFPVHAFNYNIEYINNPGSFIEYLIVNNFIKENDKILSINEYIRPSFKLEKKLKNQISPKNFKRILINRKFNFLRLLINLFSIPYLFFYFFIKNKSFSFSFFSYFVRNYLLSQHFNFLIQKIQNRKITIKNIFVLNHQNISGLIYKKYQKLIKFFNYSQHYTIATSSINSYLIGNNKGLDLSKIISELHTRLFSEFHLNPINFSNYSKNFSKFRNLINQKYNIRTLDKNSKIEINNSYFKEKVFSNIGYENLEFIKFNSSKNIMFCDNTIESMELNFSRDIMGDIIALKEFIYHFHKEIYEVSKESNYNLYFKGKYMNNLVLNLMMEEISNSLNIKIYVINSYSKIILPNNQKFDLTIHLPFSSTYYTFNHLSKKSIYFIPTDYIEIFEQNINDICVGKENLKNLLK